MVAAAILFISLSKQSGHNKTELNSTRLGCNLLQFSQVVPTKNHSIYEVLVFVSCVFLGDKHFTMLDLSVGGADILERILHVSEDPAMSGFMLYLRVKAAAMAGMGAIFFVFVLPKLG
jgi:hypothetical protein